MKISTAFFLLLFAGGSASATCISYERMEGGDFRSEYQGSAYHDIYRDGFLVASIHVYDYETTYGSRFNENKDAGQEIAEAMKANCSGVSSGEPRQSN